MILLLLVGALALLPIAIVCIAISAPEKIIWRRDE